jgi:hypothetical protein
MSNSNKDFSIDYIKKNTIFLKELLKQQKNYKLKDINEIDYFVKDHFIEVKFDEKIFKTDYRIMSIMNQWKQMYSYTPGLMEGVDIIALLLDKIIKTPGIDILKIFQSDEWKKLLALRGPVETILEMSCKRCNAIFFSMGLSGFFDGDGYVCDKCGNVYFKSLYDNTEIPECGCGGHYKNNCPFCGNNDAVTIGEKSPYWYFSNHKFVRDGV